MAVIDRIFERLGLVTRRQLSVERRHAYTQGFSEAVETSAEDEPSSGTLAKYGYKSLGDGGVRKSDISPEKQLNLAWGLWQKNPVAKRAMAIKRDYVIGSGVAPQAEDSPELQELLDAFWEGNKLDERAGEFAHQLFILGEQLFPVFVRQSDGQVRIGYIDPGQIERVETDPDNAMRRVAIVLSASLETDSWRSGHDKRVYRIVQEAESVVENGVVASKVPPEYEGRLITARQAQGANLLAPWEIVMLKNYSLTEYSGSCLYYRTNAMSNQPRGTSDLLSGADWMDVTDEMLFSLADREQMAGYFAWIVKVMGDQAEVDERASAIRKSGPPKRGMVQIVNESENWEFNAPDLKQSGTIDTYRAAFNHVWGGLGFPEAWYSRGSETNRATAQAQGDPTWKSLKHEQGVVQRMLIEPTRFAVDQAVISGVYSQEDEAFTIPMPEMVTRDVAELATALSEAMSGLQIGLMENLVPREKAIEVVAKLFAEIGVEMTPEEVMSNEVGKGVKAAEEAPFRQIIRAVWGDYPGGPTAEY